MLGCGIRLRLIKFVILTGCSWVRHFTCCLPFLLFFARVVVFCLCFSFLVFLAGGFRVLFISVFVLLISFEIGV